MANRIENIMGLGSDKNQFTEGTSIFRTAFYRVFVATNSFKETPYKLSPSTIKEKSLWPGIFLGNTPPKNKISKFFFGFGSTLSMAPKLIEFLFYLPALWLQHLENLVGSIKKGDSWLIAKGKDIALFFIISFKYFFGALKVAVSLVSSPLSNAVRLIQTVPPWIGKLFFAASSITFGILLGQILLPLLLPTIAEGLLLEWLPAQAWGLIGVVLVMLISKGLPSQIMRQGGDSDESLTVKRNEVDATPEKDAKNIDPGIKKKQSTHGNLVGRNNRLGDRSDSTRPESKTDSDSLTKSESGSFSSATGEFSGGDSCYTRSLPSSPSSFDTHELTEEASPEHLQNLSYIQDSKGIEPNGQLKQEILDLLKKEDKKYTDADIQLAFRRDNLFSHPELNSLIMLQKINLLGKQRNTKIKELQVKIKNLQEFINKNVAELNHKTFGEILYEENAVLVRPNKKNKKLFTYETWKELKSTFMRIDPSKNHKAELAAARGILRNEIRLLYDEIEKQLNPNTPIGGVNENVVGASYADIGSRTGNTEHSRSASPTASVASNSSNSVRLHSTLSGSEDGLSSGTTSDGSYQDSYNSYSP
jgi:hypothetical protein